MKAYTDLEQSKVLAKILPLESADMWWAWYSNPLSNGHYDNFPMFCKPVCNPDESVPCWSLAALLGVLPNSIYDNTDEYSQLEFSKISVAYHDMNGGIKLGSIKDNLVDACYEMIIELHEKNLL